MRNLKRFYLHLVQYVVVMGVLAAINLAFTPVYFWFLWPLGFWGLGLIVHGMTVFDKVPFLNGAWERRQVERRLGRPLTRN
ncbi:2TM domain-containing protein [Sphingomonas sp. RS6]